MVGLNIMTWHWVESNELRNEHLITFNGDYHWNPFWDVFISYSVFSSLLISISMGFFPVPFSSCAYSFVLTQPDRVLCRTHSRCTYTHTHRAFGKVIFFKPFYLLLFNFFSALAMPRAFSTFFHFEITPLQIGFWVLFMRFISDTFSVLLLCTAGSHTTFGVDYRWRI